ncbi:MAG: trypsin-like peptidase domain-containing protein [Phycisphaerae bacterium]
MHTRVRLCLAVAVWAVPAATAPAATTVEPEAVRRTVGPAVCTVTVENGWGIPQSVATGWLLGDGRFVVTDLGALKVRGAARASLRFDDGGTASAETFGMADPSLGLAVLKVDGEAPVRKGLALATELPALAPSSPVATAGYDWGDGLRVTAARLLPGPKIRMVASRSGVAPPEGVDRFLRIEGERLHAASGSAVTDADGRVLAVRLDVEAKGMASVLAMPATTLRASLLTAAPELKPLAALPDPYWPVRVLRLPGEPVGLDTFTKASNAIGRAMVCDRCDGEGVLKGRGWIFGRDYRCPQCLGTGIHLSPEVVEMLAEWARQGTRVAWAPEMDGRTRSGVRKIGVEMLARLAPVGRRLRRTFGPLGRLNVTRANARDPQGVLLFARVAEQVEGPDGQYLMLDAFCIFNNIMKITYYLCLY